MFASFAIAAILTGCCGTAIGAADAGVSPEATRQLRAALHSVVAGRPVEGPCLLQKTGRELVALRSDLTGHQLHSKMRELARAAARDCSAPEFDRRALPDGDARAASLLAGGRNLPLLL